MRKIALCLVIAILIGCSSCATVLGGKVLYCQKRKPEKEQPKRKLQVGYFIVDIIFLPALAIDFSTGAIYRPCQPVK